MGVKYTVDEMCRIIGADSLGFLSLNALSEIAKNLNCGYCDGCFTGKYPMDVSDVDHEVELDGKYRNLSESEV